MTVEVQYWLAEIDQHCNPTLVDGPHGNPEGVSKALGIFKVCGFIGERRFALATVELSPVEPAEVEDSPLAAMCRARPNVALKSAKRDRNVTGEYRGHPSSKPYEK